ncbi:hypothetical protein [Streptomyces hygroscopicus]
MALLSVAAVTAAVSAGLLRAQNLSTVVTVAALVTAAAYFLTMTA